MKESALSRLPCTILTSAEGDGGRYITMWAYIKNMIQKLAMGECETNLMYHSSFTHSIMFVKRIASELVNNKNGIINYSVWNQKSFWKDEHEQSLCACMKSYFVNNKREGEWDGANVCAISVCAKEKAKIQCRE